MTLKESSDLIISDLKGYSPEKIILFGSAVRGDSDQYSDLDIVIIKHTKKRFLERLIEASKFIRDELYPIDVFVYTPEEFKLMQEEGNSFIEQVLKEGRVIYEKSQGK